MRVLRTITAADMRGINRTAVLDLIRREGPIPRTLIAERLQVSLPTVMRIVDELIEENLVRPSGAKQWSGGRRRALLEFNAQGHLTVGVDLGGTKMFGAVADLAGEILHETAVSRHGTVGEACYERMVELIEELLAFARQTGRSILGIGIGAPGVTDYTEGVVLFAPSLEWRDLPLKRRLVERFNMPLIVENDVNLAALGELWFGSGQNVSNLVQIAIGTGIGAGVVIEGAIYRGAHQAAGEIGYLLPNRSNLGQIYEGFGALEQIASGNGIAERARQILSEQGRLTEKLSAEEVFEACRGGESWACQVVSETVDYLAQAIVAVNQCFDPELIVLGGGVARSADLLIQPILRRLEGTAPFAPRLVASKLGHRATVLGAVINLLHYSSGYFGVRNMF